MSPEQVIAHYGGHESKVSVAAEMLNVTRATIYNWRNNGIVPGWWQKYIALDTRGKLKVDDPKKRKPNGSKRPK